jgi:hypothetical protein
MAFTDERLIEISDRYGLTKTLLDENGDVVVDEDNNTTQVAGLNKDTFKVYNADKNVDINLLKKTVITNNTEVGYWATMLNGKWELVFDTDPILIDPNGIFTEIKE